MTPSEIAYIDAHLGLDDIEIDFADEDDVSGWADRLSDVLGREVFLEEVWEWFDAEEHDGYGHGV